MNRPILLPLVCLSFALAAPLLAGRPPADPAAEVVGRTTDGLVTPVNQRVTPEGRQVELPAVRPNAIALSPDGKLLVTSGLKSELIAVDPATGAIVQHVRFPEAKRSWSTGAAAMDELEPDQQPKLSFTGLTFSRDGTRVFLSNVNGDIKVFAVDAGHHLEPLTSFPLPAANAPGRQAEIPAGLAVSADGRRLYVGLNLSNRLAELDAATGQVLRTWDVGVAPYDVVVLGEQAYVSNWGGRRPEPDSVVGDAGRGMNARVDDRSVASEGSVTVLGLKTNARAEIVTGRHAGALAASPDGKHVVVANAGSDTLSIIDTQTNTVVETVSARRNAADLFGAQPNALTFDASGDRLYVCNGTQNAVAVFQFTQRAGLGRRYQPGKTSWLGLIPVGWFPGGIAFQREADVLCVANLKSIAPDKLPTHLGARGYNTRQRYGSLSLVPVPRDRALEGMTAKALANLRYPLLAAAALPPRADQPARPVPERAGEPSVFRHVIYIIKENRTYDQVLGDIPAGNGEPKFCTFGREVTPNQHKLVENFVLLDNTYCCSILSADGHQWTDSGLANEYIERSFAGWPRSYGNDALAYASTGFIWNDAAEHGRTVVDFGEFSYAQPQWSRSGARGTPRFLDCYQDFLNGGGAVTYTNRLRVASMKRFLARDAIGWNLDIPDVQRVARFTAALKRYEAEDNLPALIVMWVPNDHTSGTRPGTPTPKAQVADNDLAVGRLVEAVSHSKYWRDTCIFAIEDDPQGGWDHVSAYRTTAYVASAYTRRGAVVHAQYNQLSLLRTMELMLGIPPMNQMDATATPMTACFTAQPDFTPFDAVPNQVPLDQMNRAAAAIDDPVLRRDARTSARLPLDDEDDCPEDVFNGILWRALKGAATPYPTVALSAQTR